MHNANRAGRRSLRWRIGILALLALAACPNPDPNPVGPGGPDAAPTRPDAAVPPDGGPAAESPRMEELTGAGGRMSGGGYSLDFQIGHPADQGRATNGGGVTLEGGAAVKP